MSIASGNNESTHDQQVCLATSRNARMNWTRILSSRLLLPIKVPIAILLILPFALVVMLVARGGWDPAEVEDSPDGATEPLVSLGGE
jgi:hypothetical protein